MLSFLGSDVSRHLANRTKTNDDLFDEYLALVAYGKAPSYVRDISALLRKFQTFLGGFPPSTSLAVAFLDGYRGRTLATRTRYLTVMNTFFKWYNGEAVPLKIRAPHTLPQLVPAKDIDQLKERMAEKRTHKKSLDRDLLLVETFTGTGARRADLANLRVGDLHLNLARPIVVFRNGKGGRDRTVPLPPTLARKLASFVAGKRPSDSVFGLKPKSISHKLRIWADKAGLPDLHTHSLRHFTATTLFQRGANPRAVQALLGHESLETTMRYAAVTGDEVASLADLLESEVSADDSTYQKEESHEKEA